MERKRAKTARRLPAQVAADFGLVMELVAQADSDGARLHGLGRADGDYRTDDHDRASENLHFSTRARDRAVLAFLKEHGETLLTHLREAANAR